MNTPSTSAILKKLSPEPVPLADISDFFRPFGHHFNVHMVLDYLNHTNISGNKLRKLLFPLGHILHNDCQAVASFGGYFSNHLSALAWAGYHLGFRTTGYINGEKPGFLGYTLRFLEEMGMELRYLSRGRYREMIKFPDDPLLPPSVYHIPMGGKSAGAIPGFKDFVHDINLRSGSLYDEWWISYGTGTSALAIANYLEEDQCLLARGAVKDESVFDPAALHSLGLDDKLLSKIKFSADVQFGGIGRTNSGLLRLLHQFHDLTGIPLDPLYTGKLVAAFLEYLNKGNGKSGRHYLLIHSGGIQGIYGFNEMNKTHLPVLSDHDKIMKRTVFTI